LVKLGTEEILTNVVLALRSTNQNLVIAAVRCLAGFFQTEEKAIFNITREQGYLQDAQNLLYRAEDDLDTNTRKEVLWGLSNFVCDGTESTQAFVAHSLLTKKVIEMNSSEIYVLRNESCWVLFNAMDEMNVADQKILWE
jgi:hypothetical protein